MKLSIKKQFLLLFLLVLVISFILLSVLLRTTVDTCFHDYKWKQQSDKVFSHIIEQLEDHYSSKKSWAGFNGNELGRLAMNEGCYFTLYDMNGKLIWTTEHTIGLNDNGQSRYWRNIYPVIYNNQMAGKVHIGQFTDTIYSKSDIHFKEEVISYVLLSLVAVLILTLPLMMFLSSRLSMPITYLQEQADKMTKGDLQTEIKVQSVTKEITKLADSLNRLRKSLMQQEELRKQLTSDISHELRTPLNIIQNQLEAIIDGVMEADNERLESLLTEIKRLTSLVSELEKITQIESDNIIHDIALVNLKDTVLNVCSMFYASFQRKNIEFLVETQPGIIVKAQEDKLKQLIINIISNALKYTESGSVKVKTYMEDDHAVFEVKDTGVGLSQEEISKIFERFYRVEKSRNRNTGGAGLGLSIVKNIADSHGWEINVESDGKTGTTFKVNF